MANSSTCAACGFFSLIIGMIFNILSLSTSHWIHLQRFDIGLMKHCNLVEKTCEDNFGSSFEIYAAPDKLNFFRFMQVSFTLSCLGCLACISIAILIFTKFLDLPHVYRYLSILNILVFLLETVSVIWFGEMGKDIFGYEISTLGWSFYVAIVGCVFLGLSATFHTAEAIKAAQVLKNVHHRFTVWSTPYTLFTNQE